MASLMEELIMTLEEEDRIYKEFLPVQEEKKKVIIVNDLAALRAITEKEQEVIQQIGALERKREETLRNIGVVLNKDPETLSIPALLKLLERQPEEKRRLSLAYDSLKGTVRRLMDINALNLSLIQESLEMIEFNLNFIQSTRMSPGNNYDKDAKGIDMSEDQPGVFDAWQ